MKKIVFAILMVCLSGYGWTAEPAKSSHKWTLIMTAIGAGGGFALGAYIGLSAFDDAINSDEKVWATSLGCAAGGGIVGYFVGRHMDHSHHTAAKLPPGMTEEGILWPANEAPICLDLQPGAWRPSLLHEIREYPVHPLPDKTE